MDSDKGNDYSFKIVVTNKDHKQIYSVDRGKKIKSELWI